MAARVPESRAVDVGIDADDVDPSRSQLSHLLGDSGVVRVKRRNRNTGNVAHVRKLAQPVDLPLDGAIVDLHDD